MAYNLKPTNSDTLAGHLTKEMDPQRTTVLYQQNKTAESSTHVANSNAASYATLEPNNLNSRGLGRGAYREKQNQIKLQSYTEQIGMTELFTPHFKKYLIMKADS